MKEIWKDVKNFEDKYEISIFGRIKNKKTNHIYKTTNQYGDYFRVNLFDKGKRKTILIHRVVAEAFIPNPENLPCVNHKDLNKQNNCIDNLEWCTYSYNTKDAILKGATTMSGFNKHNKNKFNKKYGEIYQYDLKDNLINVYNNLNEAYENTGVCKRNILHCINHQEGRTQAGGYRWKSEKEVIKDGI